MVRKMPYCPDCKTEYREGFTTCSDCGKQLVGGTPTENTNAENATPKQTASNEMILLTLADDQFECDLICNMLRESGIPAVHKYQGADSYLHVYMGRTNENIQIYVPRSEYDTAKEIIGANFSNKAFMPPDNTGDDNEKQRNKKRNRQIRITLCCFFAVLAAVYIFTLFVK